ncbi:hypothetical protein HB779_17930 [Phyllobacterium sp. 628]|uniref:hypothetical protein n=1 Tax=Phyllobacterium sp. 628 TaxID=2718938 RepID=UPI0016628AFA|nr:hypothetical protein [Phyllobacterium sp. 628]QND53560.1 hypothetical protein HB779_17930 [Phyllobacterium sp. 628]
MSICNEHHTNHPAGLGDRLFATVAHTVEHITAAVGHSRDIFIRQRRLRATEAALDGLPEGIRSDIGWPDLYDRQIIECNTAGRTHQ